MKRKNWDYVANGQVEPKVSPQALAQVVLQSMQRDRYEIRVGRTKGLMALNRFSPVLVESMVRNK